jgi:hypothetical protein
MINFLNSLKGCFDNTLFRVGTFMISCVKGQGNHVEQTFVENLYESPQSLCSMSKFVGNYKLELQYITFPNFEIYRKAIFEEKYDTLRFLGLSGLGKTRLFYELFKEKKGNEHNYYCHSASGEQLINELRNKFHEEKEEGYIVLDNCDGTTFAKVVKLRSEIDCNFKVIGIYNDPSDDVGNRRLILSKHDFKSAIDKYIEDAVPRNPNVDNDIVEQIKSLSDGFPFIAFKLVKTYKEKSSTSLIGEDDLWKAMSGYVSLDEKQQRVIETLSLFDPLGIDAEGISDIKSLKKANGITSLSSRISDEEVDEIFQYVIKLFKQKELIDQSGCWIQVRPLPLAVWLVGKWFERCTPERMANVVKYLEQMEDQQTAKRLKNAMCKRIKFMQDNENAKKLFDALLGDEGAFSSEEVVGSDFGSQLFLAMSIVNPVAVTDCLYRILFHRDTDWICHTISGNIRRNYVNALEHLCFTKETFDKAILLMAKFALAENEEWANNATGQFLQLYQIELPGTEVSLAQRMNSLVEVKRLLGSSANPLLIQALDYAFAYRGFSRLVGAEKFGTKTLKDFNPNGREILEYWTNCIAFIEQLLSEYPELVNSAAEVVEKRVSQIGWKAGFMDLAYRLIEVIVNIRGDQWFAMKKNLLTIKKNVQNRISGADSQKLESWIQRLGSSDFAESLSEASYEFNMDYSTLSFETRMSKAEDFFLDYVQLFRDERYYENEKVIQSLMDSEYTINNFVRILPKKLDQSQTAQLFSTIIRCLSDKELKYSSRFVSTFYFYVADESTKSVFLQSLLKGGHYFLYVELMAASEDKGISILKTICSVIKENRLTESEILMVYLLNIPLYSANQMAEICHYIKENFESTDELLLKFVLDNMYLDKLMQEPMKSIIFELLLSYTPSSEGKVDPYAVSNFVVKILKEQYIPEFASKYNKKLINDIAKQGFVCILDTIYDALLPKYESVALEDILNELSDKDSPFWTLACRGLGSGFGFGEGPLFRCDMEKIKKRCLKEAEGVLPYRLAYSAPVFNGKDNSSFSEFFLWLIDNFNQFKYKEEILSHFSANYGSYSWEGSPIPLYEALQKCLTRVKGLNVHLLVRDWAEKEYNKFDKSIKHEVNAETYRMLAFR